MMKEEMTEEKERSQIIRIYYREGTYEELNYLRDIN